MHKKDAEENATFLHHAYAVGFAGQIQRPFQEPLEVQAATALPASGGFGQACVRGFCYKNLIHFDVARTVVTGSTAEDENGKRVWDTLVSASIENLNIMDQVTARRLSGHISSRFTEGDERVVTTAIRARFEGLLIGGHSEQDVNLDIHEPSQDPEEKGSLPVAKNFRLSLATMFQNHRCYDESLNRFSIPNFGIVYMARFVDRPDLQRLTLLRLELGCPVEGRVAAGEVASFGLPYPPE